MILLNYWLLVSSLFILGISANTSSIAAETATKAGAATVAASPDAVIQKAVNELSVLTKGKAAGAHSENIHEDVERILAPYVDVPLMARLAVGKHWRVASPQQRERLTAEYRELLIATYSIPLQALRESRVAVRTISEQQDNTRARVRVDVIPPDNTPVELIFSLYVKDNLWRVYDMSVEGISLTSNYRTEFSAIIQQQGIDGLIAQLADKNHKRRTQTM